MRVMTTRRPADAQPQAAPPLDWAPPSTFEEKLKRALVPARLELARVVARELRKGEPELKLAPLIADRSRLALDIGANRGIWTHVLAKAGFETHAFEPNPKLYAVLAAAAPKAATAHQIALSDRDGDAVLKVPRGERGYSNQHASLEEARIGDSPFGEVRVRAAKLDGLGLGPVGFMKIDVEGHEQAVIDGARDTIARDRPAMIIELEERHTGFPIEQSIAEIECLGYQSFVMREGRLQRRDVAFDPERDHRARVDAPGYIFNFIFLPIPKTP